MTDQPNILFILTDQQRPETLGFLGKTPCRTPNIDRIASSGTSFDNAITPCPLCSPARASIFTGMYPTQNDMMDNNACALTSCEMLDHFRNSGYQINYAGKWHMGEDNIGNFTDRHAGESTKIYSKWCLDQGLIDGWMFNDPATRTTRTPSMSIPKVHRQNLPVNKTNEAYVTDFAIDMIRNRDRGKPFFQVCSYNGPHPPFMIPEPYFSMYDPQDVVMPANFGPDEGEHQVHTESFYRQLFLDHGEDFDEWRASYAVYWGFVTMIDDFVGKLLKTLEDEGLSENTIIVYTSDHGENLGAHGLWQKMVSFEESIRVPMIIKEPNGARVSSQTPASLIDLAPTLAALIDLPNHANWSGRNLWEADHSESRRPAQFAMQQPIGDWMKTVDWRMIKADGFKYTWHFGMDEELFDLSTNSDEVENLSGKVEYRQRLHAMRSELGEFLRDTNDPIYPAWISDGREGCADA